MSLLVVAGASADELDALGLPTLCYATSSGDVNAMEALLAAGASVNGPVGAAETPLMAAAEAGQVEAVRLLLQRGADAGLAQAAQAAQPGETALHKAARRGLVSVMDALVNAGATLSAVDGNGWQPLHTAVWAGQVEAAEWMLQQEHRADVHARTGAGSQPIHLAAICGARACIQVLVERGADVNARLPNNGRTPLHLAAGGRHTAAVHALLQAGADAAATDAAGLTPLRVAVMAGALGPVYALVTGAGPGAGALAADSGVAVAHALDARAYAAAGLMLKAGAARPEGHPYLGRAEPALVARVQEPSSITANVICTVVRTAASMRREAWTQGGSVGRRLGALAGMLEQFGADHARGRAASPAESIERLTDTLQVRARRDQCQEPRQWGAQ